MRKVIKEKEKVLDEVGEFFDKNVDAYRYVISNRGDYYFLEFIKATQNHNSALLDIGGGAGSFAKLLVDNCPNLGVVVLDPSEGLLSEIDDVRVKKVNGCLPNDMPLVSHFNYVHIRHVLHHITGSSIGKSKELVRLSLMTMKECLNDDGFLLVHDTFYEGYLFPPISRTLVFNLLALQKRVGRIIPSKEFLAGLEVCFYTRSEFKSMLGDCGFEIVDYCEEYWVRTDIKRAMKKWAMLVKDWGEMMFILRKAK